MKDRTRASQIGSALLAVILFAGASPAAATLCVACPQAGVATESAQGQLVFTTAYGFSLESTLTGEAPDRSVAVYLPPSYDSSPERRYAVLYLLHGIYGTHADWVGSEVPPAGTPRRPNRSTIQGVMDGGIAAQRIAEMIVVAPDQRTQAGGSFYTNSEVTGYWEDFTVVDLVDHIDSTYRTLARASSRGLAGFSMGGYGALKIGMKHPDVFQAVYGMNAAVLGWAGDLTEENPAYGGALDAVGVMNAALRTPDPSADFLTPTILCIAQAFSPDATRPFFVDLPYESRDGALIRSEPAFGRWTDEMPLYMVEDYRENLLRLKGLRFDSGRYDPFSHIVATNRELSERLTQLDVPHVFEEYNGDHGNRLWSEEGRMSTEVLPWFSRLLELE